jgi:hypothetical protein
MQESDARYLDRIAADLAELLGPQVAIESLERIGSDASAETRLRLRYGIAGHHGASEGSGPSLTAAHADLRRAASREWIGALTSTPPRRRRSRRRTLGPVAAPLASLITMSLIVLGPAIVLIAKNLGA